MTEKIIIFDGGKYYSKKTHSNVKLETFVVGLWR